ncbi:MAG: hypothetical protein AAFQ94_17630 [Bacteroidota bacterium]
MRKSSDIQQKAITQSFQLQVWLYSRQERSVYVTDENGGYHNRRAANPRNRIYIEGFRDGQNNLMYNEGYDNGRAGYRKQYPNNGYYN